jgi:hypothetical protein
MSVQVPEEDSPEVADLKRLVSQLTPEALTEAATKLDDRAQKLRQRARGYEDLATRARALATAITGVPLP